MNRFIEKAGDKLFYRSGGGITTQSIARNEYQEAIDKIYVRLIETIRFQDGRFNKPGLS